MTLKLYQFIINNLVAANLIEQIFKGIEDSAVSVAYTTIGDFSIRVKI